MNCASCDIVKLFSRFIDIWMIKFVAPDDSVEFIIYLIVVGLETIQFVCFLSLQVFDLDGVERNSECRMMVVFVHYTPSNTGD